MKLSEVESAAHHRLLLGPYTDIWGEAGIVTTSVTLLGGEPGAGKSTLMLELMKILGGGVYYSGEEDPGEVKARADRLEAPCETIEIVNALGDFDIITSIKDDLPSQTPLVVVDSLSALLENFAEAKKFLRRAKAYASESQSPVIVIDHSTKDDLLAGPRTYQHLVDTLVTFRRDDPKDPNSHRILQCHKNRFGPETLRIFRMTESGLVPHKIPVGTEDAKET